jgi:hypothetical protein
MEETDAALGASNRQFSEHGAMLEGGMQVNGEALPGFTGTRGWWGAAKNRGINIRMQADRFMVRSHSSAPSKKFSRLISGGHVHQVFCSLCQAGSRGLLLLLRS